ncbi:response regulator [Variovorax sp. PAMC 28711]|uniref:response regulator n=1 Tax=Variovorax sp. PAMC 28711 TaxID=1795631 RepID=UPI00078EC5B8|nr:response regulator [Variovorax sp. PAMC 28711]AMM25490.1 hybrid sensor histidine kinase/response regulator [Variovorax sp. PAMC 28711]
MPPPNAALTDRYADIFVGHSEMATRMRQHDWAATSVGPPERWPQSLKVAIRILLTSRFEMWLGWGPDLAFFYNDAYRPTLGLKHPTALGQPTRVVWREIWDDVKGRIHTVYDKGESTWDRALLLILERSGYPEETYHTFSYSPLIGDGGRIEGIFCAVSEDTDRVLSERRLAALNDLAARLATADLRSSVVEAACEALGTVTHDLPFSMLYLFDKSGHARRACHAGIADDHRLAPMHIAPGNDSLWGTHRILAGDPHVQCPLAAAADVPHGRWTLPSPGALVVPLAAQGSTRPAGFLVSGLNPHRRLDEDHIGFVKLMAGQIAASLANAAAFEARTAERDRMRDLFKQAPSFMCVLSGTDHVLELANASYRQLVGHREIEGKPVHIALPELAQQGFVELLDEVYKSRKPFLGQAMPIALQRQPGAPLENRYLDFVYQPIVDGHGAATGIFVAGYDVTDQVQAESKLRTLNDNLESRIAGRTQDLEDALARLRKESEEREAAQEALRQAQKMEAVGQLTGGIAHDFNNLLQGITGSLDVLKLRLQLGKTDNLERLIAGAMASAQRAAGLTHRLLAFSRRQPLDPKPVKANQLVAPMEDLLRRTMGERIRIELVLAAGLWTTLCDANQLESAILNLCINARDAMPDGGMLTIETSNTSLDDSYVAQTQTLDLKAGQYVCVSVTDTGAGMTADVLAKAFEPFFTTKPIGQGTGLGLSMIYGFAKQSHGLVKLYSEPGKGTSAKLYLPRHRGEAAPPQSIPQIRSDHHTEVGETLMVVEDEPVVRTLVVDLLQGLGYRTVEAADGAQALRILQSEQRVDLLVTDVGLPLMNGRQVYDAARLTRPDLKVLFMTGYAENAMLAHGFLKPGMEMITKPFAMEKLASKVLKMLRPHDRAAD